MKPSAAIPIYNKEASLPAPYARPTARLRYTYRSMSRLVLHGITAFSDAPLHAAALSGFVVADAAFLVMLYPLFSKHITHDYQPGWPSPMGSSLFLGGVQLISVGIVGESIARPSVNVRNRLLYMVSQTNIPA